MPYAKKEDNLKWRERNRERLKKQMRAGHLRRRYGLTVEQYNEMVITQHGVCWICYIKKPLFIDHNHTSGRVRGLLCDECNKGLGHFRENKDHLLAAIHYLEKYES